MENNTEKPKQMIKIYELWKTTYTGDEYSKDSKEDLIATYESKIFAKQEKERLNLIETQKGNELPGYYLRAKLRKVEYNANMTEINYHSSLSDALNNLMPQDTDFIFLRHELSEGEDIKKHKHQNANEWIVFERGNLEILVDSKTQQIDTTDLKETCSIYFPKEIPHSLTALSNIKYYVLRDKKDEVL